MQLAEMIFALAAVFGGAFVRGYSGFGSALIWVSSLSLILPPTDVVPVVFALDLAASLQLLPKVWRDIDWRSLRWLLLGTAAAMPLGIYVLASLPPAPIRMAIAAVVLTVTALLWRGFALRRTPGPGATVLTGTLCGLLGGSVGIGGPPAILLYFSSPAAVAVSRASLIVFLSGTDLFGLAAAAHQGLITQEVALRAALLVPVVLVGVALGNRRFIQTQPETFRRFVLFLLAALSIGLFVRTVLYA